MDDIKTIAHQIIGKAYTKYYSDAFAIFRQARIPAYICQDLVQNVFVKLLAIDIIDESQVRGLIIVTAYHLRTDYLRRQAIFNNKVSKELTTTSPACYNDHRAECHELELIERQSCDRLPPVDRKVYELTRFEDKSPKEISILTGITVKATECRLYRARKRVREEVRWRMEA